MVRRCEHDTILRRAGLSIIMLASAAGTGPVALGVDFNLTNDVVPGTGPAFDPDGTKLFEIVQEAADIWSGIIRDTHTIDVGVQWVDFANAEISSANITSFTGDRADEVRLFFDRSDRLWFFDPTLDDDSEYDVSQTLFRDLESADRSDWYNGTAPGLFEAGFDGLAKETAPANAVDGYDLFSAALHEVGSTLGVPPINPASTELNDGDYDIDPVFLAGTALGIESLAGGLDSSLAVLNDFLEPGLRRRVSATDVLAVAASGGWTGVDLPRKDFLTGSDWNNPGNWVGNRVPDDDSETYLRHGGAVSMSADGEAGDLIIIDNSSLDTDAHTLTVTGTTTLGNGGELIVSTGGGLVTNTLELNPNEADGGVTFVGGTVTVNENLTLANTQMIDGFGGLVVGGLFDNQGSIFANSGTLVLGSIDAGTVDLDGSTENGLVEVGSSSTGAQLLVDGLLADDLDGTLSISSQGTATFSQPWTLSTGGTIELNDSTLASTQGMTLNGALSGTGTIQGDVTLNGTITNQTGTLRFEGIVLGTGNGLSGNVFEFGAGGGFTGGGNVDSKIIGEAGSTITATGDLTLGDASHPAGFATQGVLDVGSSTVTLLDSTTAVLGSDTILNGGTLVAPNGVTLGNGDTLSGVGTVEAQVNTNNGSIAGGTGTLRFEGNVIGGGSGFTGDTIEFGSTGSFSGSGAIAAKVSGEAGSLITATGSLTLGDPNSSDGFATSGDLIIGSHTVTLGDANGATLGGLTSITGGRLAGAPIEIGLTGTLSGRGAIESNVTLNGMIAGSPGTLHFQGLVLNLSGVAFSGDVVRFTDSGGYIGTGTVGAKIVGEPGSFITATGDLTMGDVNDPAGFRHKGVLNVDSHTVTLLDANAATLGSETILNGGTLSAVNVLALGAGDTLSGVGTVAADLNTNTGSIAGGTGTLRFEGLVNGSGSGVTGDTIEFAGTGGFSGGGAIAAKVNGLSGSTITATGNVTLGDAASTSGFSTDGSLDVGANTVTLLDANGADLNGTTTLGGGTLVAANGVTLAGTLEGTGQVQAAVNALGSSVITPTGNLTVGDPSDTGGFITQGTINVGGSTLTINDADVATLAGTTTLSGGTLSATNGVTLLGSLEGSGSVAGRLRGVAGSSISATGSLTLGDASVNDGFFTEGTFDVGSAAVVTLEDANEAQLQGDTTISGGTILASNGVDFTGAISGSGQVQATFFGTATSSITAVGGNLTLGNPAADNGFVMDGAISVESTGVLTLEDANVASLGPITDLSGGTLAAANGVALEDGESITGVGTVTADVNNFATGQINGGTGILRFDGMVNGLGGGISGDFISFGAGGGFIGQGTITAKIIGDAGSAITPMGDLAMGDTASSSGVQFLGDLDVGSHTVTLNDQDNAVLGGEITINGGILTASSGILLSSSGSLTGSGVVDTALISNGAIVATGDLTMGDAISGTGFEGGVDVGTHTVTLLSASGASLTGVTSLAGGTLTSQTGVVLFDQLTGSGLIQASVNGQSGSTITASGGDLTLGDASSNRGFVTRGGLNVGSNTVTLHDANVAELRGQTTIDGGTIVAANGVSLRGSLTGSGQVPGFVSAEASSTITATGDLVLGDATSSSGFSTKGVLDVGSSTVTLFDATAATLGSNTILNGGTLIAANAVALGDGDILSGNGTIAAQVNTNTGSIAGGPGVLRFEAAVNGAGSGFTGDTIEFASTSGFSGAGVIAAKVNGEAGSTLTATGDLTMGDATSTSGFATNGDLSVDTHTVTLHDADAAVLGSSTTINGGALIAINGIDLGTSGSITGTGVVSGDVDTKAGAITGGPGSLRFNGTVNGTGSGFTGDTIIFGSTGGFSGSGVIAAKIDGGSRTTITATGDLTLGNVSNSAGFKHKGVLNVDSHTVTLLDSTAATLGKTTTLGGGVLAAVNAVALGSGDTLSGVGTVAGDLNTNTGSVAGGAGTLRFEGTVNGSGASFTGDVIEFAGGGGFVGDGTLAAKINGLAGSVITATGDLTLGDETSAFGFRTVGDLMVGSHTVTLVDSDAAELAGHTSVNAGLIDGVNGIDLIAGSTTELTNGTLSGGGGLVTVGGALSLSAGPSSLSATARFTGGSTTTLNADLRIDGVATVDAGAAMTGLASLVVMNGSMLTGDATVDAAVVNNGTVDGSGGGLTLAGMVSGVGDYSGTVRLTDTFSPGASPAAVNAKNLELASTARFVVELGGVNPGTGYDQVNASGLVSLGGTLEIDLINGFSPNLGDRFIVLTADTIDGEFDTFVGDVFVLDDNQRAIVPLLDRDNDELTIIATVGGDANLDGQVDARDLNALALNWQQPADDWTDADFNNDQFVDTADLNLLALNWQVGVDQPSLVSFDVVSAQVLAGLSIPEPGTASMLGLMSLVTLGVATKRPNRSVGRGDEAGA